MRAVCLYDDELRELYRFISVKKDEMLRYAESRVLDFNEMRALFSACEKIEKEYTEEEKNDDN